MEAPPAQDLLDEIFGSEWTGSNSRTPLRGATITKIEPVPPPSGGSTVVQQSETCFSPQAPSSLCSRANTGEETSSVVDDDAGSELDDPSISGKSLVDFTADTTTPPPRRNSNNSIRGPVHHRFRIFKIQILNFIHLIFYLFYFNSSNRDHPVQGVRRQEFRCPLWRHYLRRMQRILPAFPILRG
jgi:hypothetical protein